MYGKEIECGIALILVLAAGISMGLTGCAKAKEKPVLTMGSWRADDTAAWTALLGEYKKASGVEIQFKPTQSARLQRNAPPPA